MKEIFEEITKEIITKEDFNFFFEEIDLLERLIFKNEGTPLLEKVRGKIGDDFLIYLKKLEKEKLIPDSPNQQLSFFENIKKYVSEIPQVKLEIAFEPSKDFLLKIKRWFEETVHRDIIFDLTVNPRILGGAIIEYQGQYRDFSLTKKIDELISQKNYE